MHSFLTRLLRACFLTILLVAGSEVSAQQGAVNKENVSGDFYFRLGPSGMPVYIRGEGRNEHWETGVHLNIEHKRFELYFATAIVGAATFDNPDRFQFALGLRRKLTKKFSVQVIHTDAYNLNALPVVDLESRRPTSGVNTLWLGGRWDFERYQNRISVFARYGLRSNEPVLFTDFTKPYASWHAGMVSSGKLTEKFFFVFEPEIYASDDLKASRGKLNVGIERAINDSKFTAGGYYTINRNLGVPRGTLDYRGLPLRLTADRLFFGIKVNFGSRQ